VEPHGGDVKGALDQTSGDVDKLHTPLRDDRKPSDQHTTADQTVDEPSREHGKNSGAPDQTCSCGTAELQVAEDTGDQSNDSHHEADLDTAHRPQLRGRPKPVGGSLDIGYLGVPGNHSANDPIVPNSSTPGQAWARLVQGLP
jgi:hypothetical protein